MDCDELIRLDSRDSSAYVARGIALYFKEKYDKAIADFSEGIRLDPSASLAHQYRGYARSERRDYDGAIADFNVLLRLDADRRPPDDPKGLYARLNRGWAFFRKKEYEKAMIDFETAARMDPNEAATQHYLAWTWATCPDARFRSAKKAIDSAEKACRMEQWKEPRYLVTLAAAYAEAGNFAAAIEWQTKANALETNSELKSKGEARLELYRSKKPFRDEGS